MRYRLKITQTAHRAIRQAPAGLSREAMEIVTDLRADPRPDYSKPLQRELEGLRTIRVDGWRIVYQVKEETVTVLAFKRRNPDTYLNM